MYAENSTWMPVRAAAVGGYGHTEVFEDIAIELMATVGKFRDNDTGKHTCRTQHYLHLLAVRLRDHRCFPELADARYVDVLTKSAPLHDIGKIGIPDHILMKPGRLTPEELAIMRTHTTVGRDVITQVQHTLGAESSLLRVACELAYSHHEKWDGSGYPQALCTDAIPVAARLMAVADVYDALVSPRAYKQPWSHEQAVDFILAGRGQHFDPAVVDAFCSTHAEWRTVASNLRDC